MKDNFEASGPLLLIDGKKNVVNTESKFRCNEERNISPVEIQKKNGRRRQEKPV